MKNTCLAAFVIFLAAIFPYNGKATSVGNELHIICNSSNPSNRMRCFDYISGVVDGLVIEWLFQFATFINKRTENGRIISDALAENQLCIPAGVDMRQHVDIVSEYLRANPQERHHVSAAIIRRSLVGAFPCPPTSAARPPAPPARR